ncbi:hypothetical protein [Streptomyces sp. NPDC000410]|uniref:hypothetical protein n=1 Tax=Streptomyces sp. NPDC000410 TaxID=3154254 RepID=UPI0033247672
MEKPETAIRSDLPDLTGTSLEELRARAGDGHEEAKQRLLEAVGGIASIASGTENSWTS